MYNYKLTIAYDGTAYHGWQVQPNGITIQELVQKTIAIILRQEVVLIGSGRTDAGVHAMGQVANFHFPSLINLKRFQKSLNGLLPPDIRILSIYEVSSHFHAQHHATGKIYHYHLHLDAVQNPFQRLYSLHVKEKISLETLKVAAKQFVGTNNFLSFANEGHCGSASRDAVRTLKRLDVIDQLEGIRLEFEADGFLYKMVRNITGTLLDIARNMNQESTETIKTIKGMLEAKNRKYAGKTAPPQGLFLMEVHYKEDG